MPLAAYIGIFSMIVFLAYCSLVPGWLRPQSGMSGNTEHMLAYLVAAMLVVAIFNFADTIALLSLIVLAALLEMGQKWIPGRTAAVTHFLWSCGGVLAGGALMKSALAVGEIL